MPTAFVDPAVAGYLPDERRFYAGNWRSGAPLGKNCVNGQCIVTRSQFARVNGYSELLRKYAFDDEDLYQRLERCGFLTLRAAAGAAQLRAPHG